MAESADAADAARDTAATVNALQDQVNDLTATLESHEHIFALLRGAGMLPPPDDDGPGR